MSIFNPSVITREQNSFVSHEPNTRVKCKVPQGTNHYSRFFVNLDVNCTVCTYVYICIHTHIHTHTHTYIYIKANYIIKYVGIKPSQINNQTIYGYIVLCVGRSKGQNVYKVQGCYMENKLIF